MPNNGNTFYLNSSTADVYFSSDFNKRPRQANWNENTTIKCDREPNDEDDQFLPKTEYSKFSTNVPLRLYNFTCAPIYNINGLQSTLTVDVKIFEFHVIDCENESGNLLLEMKTWLTSGHPTVFLPQPILIRPGFFYMIEIGQIPREHYMRLDGVKKQVKLDQNIIIKFYDSELDEDGEDDDENERGSNLIVALDFNRI